MSDGEERPAPAAGLRYLHLTAAPVWEAQRAIGSYRPEGYEADGFIHCTIGEDNLLVVANAFYAGDCREQVVLEIDPSLIDAPVRFEDPDRSYPHVYGPLNVDAVIGVRRVRRSEAGRFLSTEPGERRR